jgi:uncharacterized protein (UPF0332 family)
MKHEFLEKAKENLTVAQWSYENDHYNASANRAYYAAFQATIAALANAAIITNPRISHSAAQSLFATELIRRRKIYPSHLKSYKLQSVSKKKASTPLKRAKEFVEIITKEIEK